MSPSSYQQLVEKKLELIIYSQDKSVEMNVSELLRDLYIKIYTLETVVKSLMPVVESGEPEAES